MTILNLCSIDDSALSEQGYPTLVNQLSEKNGRILCFANSEHGKTNKITGAPNEASDLSLVIHPVRPEYSLCALSINPCLWIYIATDPNFLFRRTEKPSDQTGRMPKIDLCLSLAHLSVC